MNTPNAAAAQFLVVTGDAGAAAPLPVGNEWDGLAAEAANPETDAARLTLIHDTLNDRLHSAGLPEDERRRAYRAVRGALAANPNTPARLLPHLATGRPEEFCANPAAPLVLLEEPAFVRRMPSRRPLLRCENAPRVLVAHIAETARTSSLVEEARLHVCLAGEVPDDEWAEAIRAYWRSWCAARRGRNRERLIELVALGLAPGWAAPARPVAALRRELAEAADLDTPALRLAEIVWTSRSWVVRLAAGLNPSADGEDRAAVERALIRRYLGGACWARVASACRPPVPSRAGADDPAARILDACRVAARHPRRFALYVALPAAYPGGAGDGCPWGGTFEARWGDRTGLCRFLQLMDPAAPAKYKKAGAKGPHWHERLGAALGLHPGRRKSREALERLARDGNRLVRAAAQARLRGETFDWGG